MKDSKKTREWRAQLFRKATRFESVEKTPYLSAAVTWKIFDAGYTIDQAVTDFAVMEECVRHFLDTYDVDTLMDLGIRNQFWVTEAFGSDGYYYYTPETIGIRDHAYCTPDTLMDYLRDPIRYTWETILPEKYGEEWNKKTLADWKRAYKAYMDYTKFIIHMGNVAKKEYALPSMARNNPAKGAISFGVEELMANLLGMRQLSLALRRQPEQIQEFVREWDRTHIDPIIEKMKGPDESYCFDASVMMLAQNLLNPKQFETLYWPSLERLLDAYEQNHMTVRIFAEGSLMRYTPYFGKYRKGTLAFHLEKDDPFEFRKALPNAAIIGGITTELLSGDSKDACVQRAKELIDGLPGLILSENRMLSYRNDAKSENLKAVCDFVKEYRK